MKWFNDMKLRSKMLIGLAVISIVGYFVGYMGYSAIKIIGSNGIYDSKFMIIILSIIIGVLIDIIIGLGISNTIGQSDMSFKVLMTDIDSLRNSMVQGKIETRVDETKQNGDYKKIVQDVNKIIDGITEPLSESNKVLANMAQNDLTIKMQGSYNGILKEFANNINLVNERINSVSDLFTQASLGNTSRLEALQKIGRRSENDKLMPAMILMMTTIENIIKEVSGIAETVEGGNIDARGDTSKFQGGYREILEGFNNTLDAVSKPINESRSVLSKMALNDLSLTMTGSYKGTMREFSQDINSVHARISAVVKLLIEISVGDITGLEGLMSIGKRSENDKLMPSMIVMMETIQNLVKEANSIADSAVEGNLKARSKSSKFQGGYREVLEGFNNTLDAVEEPINEAAEVLKEMAVGNLDVSMNGDYRGSYKTIKDSLNHTLESFNELLGSITDASDEVLSGSNQVSDGSQALSQGSTEQASSIEELTSSITEVAAQTKQNAVNASQANELALSAKEGAVIGNSHMKDMLKSMEDINESSSNISKIIKVIDDIAFQTNMLALNAAVEAARAGQHGKGFAVVAEEVRNLAARSTNAAKETTDLIEGSIKKVEFGTKIANNTAESLNSIVTGVTKAATLVGEIAAASNEQATAIYQINKGIEQVSDVVQTNSATAEESAAASEELSGQASMLKSMVVKFKLKRGTSTSNNQEYSGNQKKSSGANKKFVANAEVAVTKNKPKISLGNTDFGKY